MVIQYRYIFLIALLTIVPFGFVFYGVYKMVKPKTCLRMVDHEFDVVDSLNVFIDPACKHCGKKMSKVAPLNKPLAFHNKRTPFHVVRNITKEVVGNA